MLSTAVDALQLAQAAPLLAVGVLALAGAAWLYRQNRRSLAATEARMRQSANSQGKRLGAVEQAAGLLDLRRRQVEDELLSLGVNLPYWPPDGPDQSRPRRRVDRDDRHPVEDDLAAEDEIAGETQARRIPVPPLDPAVAARHRRA